MRPLARESGGRDPFVPVRIHILLAKEERRFCIADGAAESFAPRYWARLLVKLRTRYKGPRLGIALNEVKRDFSDEIRALFDLLRPN